MIIALIIGVARALAVRWFRLPVDDPIFEASVHPNLRGGDLILAVRITRPTFGDLVVCPDPEHPDNYVIGRIVGEPGDTIRLVNGQPFINGKASRVERVCDPREFTLLSPNDESEVTQACLWEALANHLHMIGSVSGHKIAPEEIEVHVEEGKYFLLSDNRLFPYDSRDYGLVETTSCKETVVARLVSKDGWMDSQNRLDYIQ